MDDHDAIIIGTGQSERGVVLLLLAVRYAIATWFVVRGSPDRAASGRALATILIRKAEEAHADAVIA